jgi:hypothetical protein
MPDISRRDAIRLFSLSATLGVWNAATVRAQSTPLVVYKDPDCGCCEKWVAHMKTNGFAPTVTNTRDIASIKRQHHVPDALASCHTALVAGYVVEGHVPAADVKRLLAQKPKGIVGLTIPGMPSSAPGMDMTPFKPYTVLSFDAQGKTMVFAEHRNG